MAKLTIIKSNKPGHNRSGNVIPIDRAKGWKKNIGGRHHRDNQCRPAAQTQAPITKPELTLVGPSEVNQVKLRINRGLVWLRAPLLGGPAPEPQPDGAA